MAELKKEKIYTPDVPPNPKMISHAVRYGNIITVSGQVGKTADGTIPETLEEQVVQAIENLKRILEAAGASLDNVMMCQCFLPRQEDFKAMNAVYERYFGAMEVPPARYTVMAGLANPKLYFEIAAIAGV